MNWTNLIPWGISFVALLFAIFTYARNGRKDRRADIEEDAQRMNEISQSLLKANLKLDQVCATTTETRADIKAMNEYMNAVEKRVSIVENELKAVWVRIDELKKGAAQ